MLMEKKLRTLIATFQNRGSFLRGMMEQPQTRGLLTGPGPGRGEWAPRSLETQVTCPLDEGARASPLGPPEQALPGSPLPS